MQNKFLAPPKAGCSSFEQLNRKRNELLDMFESILMDQYSKFTNSSTYQRPGTSSTTPTACRARTRC